MQIDFSNLEKVLKSLKDALDPAPKNDRERDGAIQRFEYTFEPTSIDLYGRCIRSDNNCDALYTNPIPPPPVNYDINKYKQYVDWWL